MGVFTSGSRGDRPEVVTDRILTVPNLLSVLRLLGLPFVYLDLVNGRDVRALVVLLVIVSSDFVDGYVARRFDQVTRVGKLVDPISDRIVLAVVAVAMVVVRILPLWALLLVVARDAVVLLGGVVLASRGIETPPVTDVGKVATFGLMAALPLFIVARAADSAQLRGSAWVIFAASSLLYYVAAGQYVRGGVRRLRDAL